VQRARGAPSCTNQPLSLFQESEQVIRSAKTRGQISIFAGATQEAKIKICPRGAKAAVWVYAGGVTRLLACVLAVVLAGPLLAQQQRPQILSRLTWFDRAGTRLGGIGPVADHGNIELSPDGTRVAVAVTDHAHETRDIWIYDATSGDRTRFTSDPADENWLIWSSDSQRVVLNSFGREHLDLFEAGAQSLAPRAVLMQDAIAKWPVSWSPDGRFVLYVTNSRTTSNDIWVLPLTGDRKAFPFLRTDASENWAAFSPDGKWVAFSSTDTGTIEVYVSPFPSNGKRFRVSADGGSQARWRRDSGEIFYLAPDRTIIAASVTISGSEFTLNGYEPLFEIRHPYGAYHAFDVTADAKRFLVNTLVVNPGGATVVASSTGSEGSDGAAGSGG
jgi:WD40 repeat protein